MAMSGQTLSRNGQSRLATVRAGAPADGGLCRRTMTGPRDRAAPASAGAAAVRHRRGDAGHHRGGLVHRPARHRSVGAGRHAAWGAHGRRGADAGAVSAGGCRGLRPVGGDGDRGVAAAARIDPYCVRGAGGVGRARPDPAGGGAGAARDRACGTRHLSLPACRDPQAGAGGGGAGRRSRRSARPGRMPRPPGPRCGRWRVCSGRRPA